MCSETIVLVVMVVRDILTDTVGLGERRLSGGQFNLRRHKRRILAQKLVYLPEQPS